MRNLRKVMKGVVVSNKMDKTVVVEVKRQVMHPRYKKLVNKKKKYYAHLEKKIEIGKEVKIMECRPLSKMKRWRVIEE